MSAHLQLYLRLLGAQIRSQLHSPLSFVLDLLATVLLTAAEFSAFALVMQRFPHLRYAATGNLPPGAGHVGSWTLGEVALLYGLAELGCALMDLLFGGFDAPNLGALVRRGGLDMLLLRPVPLTLQVFGSDFALRRVGRMVLGAGIVLFALHLHPVTWTALKALLLLLSLAGLVLFFGALFMVGGTLTFWTGENVEAMNIVTYGGRTLISYPLSIYDEWLRRAALILPVGLLSYPAALLVLDHPFPAGLPHWTAFLSPLVGLLFLAGSLSFWRYGLRFYRGSGS